MKQLRRKSRADVQPPIPHRLAQIREIAGAVNSSSDVDAILKQIVVAACHLASWWTSGIMAVNHASGYSELVARHSSHPDRTADYPTRWALDTSPSRLVIERREPIIIADAQVQAEFPGYRVDAIAKGYHTVVVLPLNATDADGNELVISVTSQDHVDVDQEELDFLVTISHLAALAVNKAKLVQAERAHSARLQRVLELSGTLLSRVLEGSTNEALLATVENVVLQPYIFVDLTSNAIYPSASPDAAFMNDREWKRHVQGPLARPLQELILSATPSDFREVCLFDLGGGSQAARTIHVEPIRIDGETVGGLLLFPKLGQLDRFDMLVAQKTLDALSAQLLRKHVAFRETSTQVSALLERIFEGDGADNPAVLARAASQGWDLTERCQLFVVATTEEADLLVNPVSAIRTVDRLVMRQFQQSAVAMVSDQLLVRIACTANNALRRAFDRLLAALQSEADLAIQGRWIIAQGSIIDSPSGFRPALEGCLRLIGLARTLGRTGLITDGDFGPFALLLSTLDAKAIPNFVDRTVGAVKKYDEKHRTTMLETAARFIDLNCRFVPTAKALSIHVSTLRYRLERLKELFSIDLADPENRLAIALAIQLQIAAAGSTHQEEAGRLPWPSVSKPTDSA